MTSNLRKILLALFVILPGAGLARLQADPPRPAAGADASPAVATAVESHPTNYQLTSGDTISVTVFREPDLTSQQRLSRDGTINLPLLGVVKIAGKNTNDAAAHIAALLDKDYIVRPQVSVSIVEYAKVKFTILGQVTNPGSFDIPGEQSIDILNAIARAGGFTRLANPSDVLVRRVTGGQEESFKVDVKRLMTDKKARRFVVQANDTISVGERFF